MALCSCFRFLDRRRITERIGRLKRILEKVRAHRSNQRKRRSRSAVPTVAIVGYTNAGKSTLLNLLAEAGVPAADQLFATLDTTTRRVEVAPGEPALLTDTVGFIRDLPDALRVAFRATLEELNEADALLHVADASSPSCAEQIESVQGVLRELGAGDKPTLMIFNKADLLEEEGRLRLKTMRRDYTPAVEMSALLGLGKAKLLEALARLVRGSLVRFTLCLPYDHGPLLALLHEQGRILEERFEQGGIALCVEAPRHVFERAAKALRERAPQVSLHVEGAGSRKEA